jgi:hypothetical protein
MSIITATNSIHLKMNGTDIQYNADGAGFTTIAAWPFTITNSNPGPSAILNVICDEDLTISSNTGGINGYFITGSQYVTFDGSGNDININAVLLYPGFIQNGTSGVNGFANVVVKNFTTNITLNSGSTLADSAGWLCQSYFGKGSAGVLIENCTNTGAVSVYDAGGICGAYAGYNSGGSVTLTSCTNTGLISGQSAGGICGAYAGYNSGGSVTLTSCTNTGLISGQSAGGICGLYAGYNSGGSVTFTLCTNTGLISGPAAGGICGLYAGSSGGSAILTSCTNTGAVSGPTAGGICGASAGFSGGSATLTKCFSTGNITGQYAGGIVGSRFATTTNQTCSITNCYSTGLISGHNAGGITGASVGRNNTSSIGVNITNSYSLGAIATSCGGICGGWDANTYINVATINISNTYSYGALTGTGSGLVAVSLTSTQINLVATNTYVAAGSWSDTNTLTGKPTSLTSGNPGTTWTTIATGQPYVLSAFSDRVYSPNSASALNSYTSNPGVFGTSFTYTKVFDSQSGAISTIRVFAYKGTNAYDYNSYNFNTFTITNTNGSALPITSTINTGTGVLQITLPNPLIITANGALDEVGLRMDPVSTGDMQYNTTTSPTWITIASGDWPVTITNSNPTSSSALAIKATTDLTISSNTGGINGYFITGSQYVTFDGSGNDININAVLLYPGFIRNGTSGVNGFANVVVKNFTTNVTLNSGSTLGYNAGWLCQSYFGKGSAGVLIENCTNTGLISRPDAGGICGAYAGYNSGGSVTLTSCTNTGPINGQYAGGICGLYAGSSGGSVTFTFCTNTGPINGQYTGGICGLYAGSSGGSVTFTSCMNTGSISRNFAGGITGASAGYNNGLVTLTTCFSTGSVTGQYAGGICGAYFAYITNQPCSITNCYSTGLISGNNAGGITGANVGYTDNASYIPVVNITNSYSLGVIATTCGGICGGWDNLAYTNVATINISNTYSYGALTGTGSGLVAVSLTSTQINLVATNTFVAAGSWSDATARAPGALVGTPNSPGVTWSSIVTGEPYVLSAYDAQIYSPNSTSSSSNYTSLQGLFQPGFTYDIVYSNQVGATLTLYVAAYKGTAPSFTEYNINTFTITNANGTNEPIQSSINRSNGILYITLPPTTPTTPTTPVQRLAVGGGGGAFWFGEYGFLYKRKGGGGGRRSTKMAPGGNTTCNSPTYLYNKYNPGNTGVGAQSTAVRRAKNIKAAVCGPKIPCGQFYNYLGLYDNYTGNPNGYVVYPAPNF